MIKFLKRVFGGGTPRVRVYSDDERPEFVDVIGRRFAAMSVNEFDRFLTRAGMSCERVHADPKQSDQWGSVVAQDALTGNLGRLIAALSRKGQPIRYAIEFDPVCFWYNVGVWYAPAGVQ
jgi:hypothetical protein